MLAVTLLLLVLLDTIGIVVVQSSTSHLKLHAGERRADGRIETVEVLLPGTVAIGPGYRDEAAIVFDVDGALIDTLPADPDDLKAAVLAAAPQADVQVVLDGVAEVIDLPSLPATDLVPSPAVRARLAGRWELALAAPVPIGGGASRVDGDLHRVPEPGTLLLLGLALAAVATGGVARGKHGIGAR